MDSALIQNGEVVQVWRNQQHGHITNKDELDGEIVLFPPGVVCCHQLWDGKELSNPPLSPAPEIIAQDGQPVRIIHSGPSADDIAAAMRQLEARLMAAIPSLPAPVDTSQHLETALQVSVLKDAHDGMAQELEALLAKVKDQEQLLKNMLAEAAKVASEGT